MKRNCMEKAPKPPAAEKKIHFTKSDVRCQSSFHQVEKSCLACCEMYLHYTTTFPSLSMQLHKSLLILEKSQKLVNSNDCQLDTMKKV